VNDRFKNEPKKAGGQRPLALEGFKGMIQASYDDPLLRQALGRADGLWSYPGVEILADKRNRLGVFRFALSGGEIRDIVVKEYSSRGVTKLKSPFLPSKAARAWRGALALEEKGLGTAFPVAYFEKRKSGFVCGSFFLSEKIEEGEEIRTLFRRLAAPDLGALVSSLGRHLSLCHDAGILHRDLSDGNILVKKDEEKNFVFYLLDTNRIRLRRKIPRLARVKNLIRLGIPPSAQKPFLEHYFGGKPLGQSLWVWYKINKAVYTGYVKLKRVLRLRQLARKLGVQ
jgi:hypothetical protein